MTEAELPREAAEADVLEQHSPVEADEELEPEIDLADEEADPADLAEQARSVGDDDEDYPYGQA